MDPFPPDGPDPAGGKAGDVDHVDHVDHVGQAVALRLRLDCAYDGTGFSGWAAQPGRRTVEGELGGALGRLFGATLSLTVAGRTDAGVHARGQVAHVDVESATYRRLTTDRSGRHGSDRLLRRLAAVLPPDLRVTACRPAPPGFDARFSALTRTYVYRLCDAPWGVDPLRRHDTTAWRRPLSHTAMRAAGLQLTGEHDFAAFCRPREGASTVRELRVLDVDRDARDVIVVTASADAFCHHMVRSLVGALIAVGEGRRGVDWPAGVLRAGVRDSAVLVAPARGLTLTGVTYPPDAGLAARARLTRQRRQGSTPLP